jgi:hypothetical protein
LNRARVVAMEPAACRSVAFLTVVLLAMNTARLLIGFVLQMSALTGSHHAIGLGSGFDAMQMHLAGSKAAGFRARQLTARDTILDALALVVLACISAGGAGGNTARQNEAQGKTDAG